MKLRVKEQQVKRIMNPGKKIAQLYPAPSAIRNSPPAPPAYRPQPLPKALQMKAANQQFVSQSRGAPAAPLAFRAQPTPRVWQPKMVDSHNFLVRKSAGQPVAPPVYRPQPTPRVLQAKESQTSNNNPALYRPAPPQGHRLTPAVRRTVEQGKAIRLRSSSPTPGAIVQLNPSPHLGRRVCLFAHHRVIQPYTPKAKEKKILISYRNRYVAANGDDEYYGSEFDEKVENAGSMDEIRQFVEAAEQKAQEKQKASAMLASKEEGTEKATQTQSKLTKEEQEKKIETKKQKKTAKKEKQAENKLDISGPPTKINPWLSPTPTLSMGSNYSPPTSSLSSPVNSGPTKVEKLVAYVKKWNGTSNEGKNVTLTPSEMEELVDGLNEITTMSGKNFKYYVGLSVGESKYNSHVCIKAIAGYSNEVSAKTTHKPTYHFVVTNQDQIPPSLTSYQLEEKS